MVHVSGAVTCTLIVRGKINKNRIKVFMNSSRVGPKIISLLVGIFKLTYRKNGTLKKFIIFFGSLLGEYSSLPEYMTIFIHSYLFGVIMNKKTLIVALSIFTAFPAMACNLKKYQKTCIGKIVAHKKIGMQKKHKKRGIIKGIIKKKKRGKVQYLYRTEYAAFKGVWLEPVSHIRLSKLNKKKYSKERRRFLKKMRK
jgi:hypothetical protein